ncbi:MAG: D-alanyl-D-alanine carboxypeptidase/D-alanyl-D-alanine-endopeptidase [Bacteroidota bacterium]
MKGLSVAFLVTCIFFLPGTLVAQTQIKQAIANLKADPVLKSANWGVSVVDLATGQEIAQHESQKCLVTASSMKALTTATALWRLGEGFRFETKLVSTGTLQANGTLKGDIWLVGSGDPSLGSARLRPEDGATALLEAWTQSVKQAGIKRITGGVYADIGKFSTLITPRKWGFEDIGNYYGAGAAGVNFMENTYRLDLKPGNKVGAPTTVVRTDPPVPGLVFENELTTGSARSGDQAYIFGVPYTSLRYLRGTIPYRKTSLFSIKGAIPDPALFTAQQLADALKTCGISLESPPAVKRCSNASSAKVLYLHQSAPLIDLIRETNHESINLFAEALLKQIALHGGKAGDTQSGLDVLEDFWASKGLSLKHAYLRDGSGLSSNNAVSPRQFTQMLSLVHKSTYGEAYKNSLPIMGKSGTLKGMAAGTAAEGRIRAKSGYIGGVRSYVGYVKTRSGKQLAFAVICNQFACSPGQMKRKLIPLMARMAEW